MSCLTIFRPDGGDFDESPAVIPFPRPTAEAGALQENAVVARAKLVYQNKTCPSCNCGSVRPIALNDGLLNSQRMTIPGTATIVAFHCNGCYHEWPAR